MDVKNAELLEKMRRQFETAPYPKVPPEQSPKDDINALYVHNFLTPYYLRNQQLIAPEETVILDAGCGSGYKSLILAHANPGARIVGIDISEKSVDLAQQRLAYHGFTNTEFHTLALEDLPSLGLEFDYINCDEVLYLVPDPTTALQAMRSVLKPQGILRTNLHSLYQRRSFFSAQELFTILGLMDAPAEELEIELIRSFFEALQDQVWLKVSCGAALAAEEGMRANLILQGDKGFTIPQTFTMLEDAGLEFISMVYWRQWQLLDLFKDRNNLPTILGLSLPDIPIATQLHLYELMQPVHRLIDFWCGHPGQTSEPVDVDAWTPDEWRQVRVHLHPQLRHEAVKAALLACIAGEKPFIFNHHLVVPTTPTSDLRLERNMAACLLPLWEEGPQTVPSLVDRWLKINPVNLMTLEPLDEATALADLCQNLKRLEVFLYVLLENQIQPFPC